MIRGSYCLEAHASGTKRPDPPGPMWLWLRGDTPGTTLPPELQRRSGRLPKSRSPRQTPPRSSSGSSQTTPQSWFPRRHPLRATRRMASHRPPLPRWRIHDAHRRQQPQLPTGRCFTDRAHRRGSSCPCYRSSPDGSIHAFEAGYSQAEAHEIFAPNDIPIEDRADLVDDALADAWLIDLFEDVGKHQCVDAGV